MAKFKQQIGEKFVDSQKLFQELDVHKIKKVRQQDFLERCLLAQTFQPFSYVSKGVGAAEAGV